MEGTRERTVPSASPNQGRGPNVGYGVGPSGDGAGSNQGLELRPLMRHAMRPGGKRTVVVPKSVGEMSHG